LAQGGVQRTGSELAAGHALALSRCSFAAAAALLVLALASDPAVVARFHFRQPLSPEALAETSRSRVLFAVGGALLLAAGVAVRRAGKAGRFRPLAARALLVVLAGFLPLFVLERATRPFVERLTSLFVPDPELRWRHRASVATTYWGTPVRTNAHGLRGPERTLAKPEGTRRVLVLGDSVVFGLLLADDADTFPARLERALAASAGGPVECLNAGVSGWSTRQERLFLEREGERFEPDLVVLGFVLNDLTERAGTAQLAYARPPGMPAWLADCGIHLALRELALRRALASDSPTGRAHRERLTPYHLMLEPDSPRARAAWDGLAPELAALHAWCRARALPIVVVAFPYALQLQDPGLDAPQRALAGLARTQELPLLDLLPAFAAAVRDGGRRVEDLFLDGLHPSATGHLMAAEEVARTLREHDAWR
jgi:lysophospholipase L1-like esterase